MERKALFGKTVTVRVQQNTKIAFCGTCKEVCWTLRRLKTIFGNRPLSSITREEFAEAMHVVNVLKKLRAERRRQG